jgi:hypothetical protein
MRRRAGHRRPQIATGLAGKLFDLVVKVAEHLVGFGKPRNSQRAEQVQILFQMEELRHVFHAVDDVLDSVAVSRKG